MKALQLAQAKFIDAFTIRMLFTDKFVQRDL